MTSYDIVFCLTGDLQRNSRALRQIRALSAEGYRILGIGLADTPRDDCIEGIEMRHLARPPGSGPRWFLTVHRLFSRVLSSLNARLVHASDLFVLPAVSRVARRTKLPYSYDSRELYPYVGATVGKPWASAFWRFIERRHIRGAAATFTVCESIADRLVEMYGITRPLVVRNVPASAPPLRTTYLREWAGVADDDVILLYQGYLKPGRGCRRMLDIAAGQPRIQAVFLGDGPLKSELESRAFAEPLVGRVHFHPAVPPDELLSVTSSADIGVCLIEPLTESLRLSLPNKLFEYIWAGLPVVASRLPEIDRVVSGFDVGFTVDPLDTDEAADAVQRLTSDSDLRAEMSARTRRVTETYSWSEASEAFVTPFRQRLSE